MSNKEISLVPASQCFSLQINQWKEEIGALSDTDLLSRSIRAAQGERNQTTRVVIYLSEIYQRDLDLQRGFKNLASFAREQLGMSDAMAYERAAVAKLSVSMPETLSKLCSGELTLSSAATIWRTIQEQESLKKQKAHGMQTVKPENALKLQPELLMPALSPQLVTQTPAASFGIKEKRELFSLALGKSKRDTQAAIENWKYARDPHASPKPKTHLVQFELTDEEQESFGHLRNLLSHKLGSMDPKQVFLWLLNQGLEKIDPERQEARIQKRKASQAKLKTEKAKQVDNLMHCNVAGKVGEEQEKQEATHEENLAGKISKANTNEEKAFENLQAQLAFKNTPLSKPLHRVPIPAALKRQIWIRDQREGCQFVDPVTGRKCASKAFLDLDHRLEVSRGGQNTEENLRLVCSSHNRRRHFWQHTDSQGSFRLK